MTAPEQPQISHPIFARCWGLLSRFAEQGFDRYRVEMLSGLTGRVLEIGAGNGLNFGHYPGAVSEVVALEPETYLRGLAASAAAQASVAVTVQDGRGEQLDFEDASFDAVVTCLVLCSVSDQTRTLAEARRVLAPGGELRFLEHVRSPQPRRSRIQAGLDRSGVWPLLAGGCHSHRDTVGGIEHAGFTLETHRYVDLPPAWAPINPIVIGTARWAG